MDNPISQIDRFLKERNYSSPWIEMNVLEPELLEQVATVHHLTKNQILFHQESFTQTCYVVKSGRFRVYFIDSEGTENCVFIAQKGCLIGEMPALDDAPNCTGARAIVPSTVYGIDNRELRSLLYKNPGLSISVLRCLIRRERILTSKIEYYKKNSAARVAISLLSLCAEYGLAGPYGVRIGIRFTHEELANLTGLNRVTVSRIYQRLKSGGVIESHKGFVVVGDTQELMRMVDE